MDIRIYKRMKNIFLSFKHHDDFGELTSDYYRAARLYDFLTEHQFNVFFSAKSVVASGDSDYTALINKALDQADVLILVASCYNNCTSCWVKYEWQNYFQEVMSGKTHGLFLSYIDGNVNDYPREIRSREAVSWSDPNAEETILEMICNHLGKKEEIQQISDKTTRRAKGSSYGYEIGDEKNRLKVQARLESRYDDSILSEIISKRRKDPFYILDVGCSSGFLTEVLFKKFEENIRVLGVDKFRECIDDFRTRFSDCDHFYAHQLDLDRPGWEDELHIAMDKIGIPHFDLVFCSMSLHHMADSAAVIKALRDFLCDDGHIYVRTNDDGLKMAYPDPNDLLGTIIRMSEKTDGISDRFHGRKIFSELYNAGYKNISIQHHSVDTAGKTEEERKLIFENVFSWRENYFRQQVYEMTKANKTDSLISSMKAYERIVDAVKKVEKYFKDPTFYFCFFITTAIAQK